MLEYSFAWLSFLQWDFCVQNLFMTMIKNKNFVWFIYGCAFGLLLSTVQQCSKYQVVSELDVHMYHLHNPRTKKVEVIITEDKLEVGKFYRLKSIKQIYLDDND